jgi:predicted RNase H-like nuclease (RuvC/YqgF family)
VSFSLILQYATLIAALTAILSALYIARNKAALENYRVTVESQEKRLKVQDDDIAGLKEDNTELKRRLDELAGERQGYEFAAEVFARAVANAGICAIAWDCGDRVLPETVESDPRPHRRSRVKVGGTD